MKKNNPLLENRDPKRTKRVLLGAFLVFWTSFSLLMLARFPMLKTHVDLYFAVQQLEAGQTLPLSDLIPFDWDRAYTFPSGTDKGTMAEKMGLDSQKELKITASKEVQYYFVHDSAIVCAIYGTTDSVGFVFEFPDDTISYQDGGVVSVEKEGHFVLTVTT